MNSENSKTCKPHILKLKLTSKLDLSLGEKVNALSNLSIYYTWKNLKSSYNNNRFKISTPTWNDEYTLELLTKETMKLLGSTKDKITKDKNGENVPHL